MFFFLGLLTTYLKVEQLILFSRAAGFYSLRSSKFVGWSKVVADSAEAPPHHAPTPPPLSHDRLAAPCPEESFPQRGTTEL